MADYPEWVTAHKRKGTYINRAGGKYYLYAAHSERVPGTGKVRRVSDGYLGRITEAEGFIPAKRKLAGPISVYEYGLTETVLSLCPNIRAGLGREFRVNGDFVMAGGMLLFMHESIGQELYETSWLSMRLPGLDMKKEPTNKQRVGMERARRMIADTLSSHFREAYPLAVSLLPLVKAVRMGDETAVAAIPDGVAVFMKQHGLKFEEVQHG